ncbi:MAG TPA: DUF6345 domain-containing protein [Armatimonadota bacterium]|jgi:hypothetical protein
MRYTNLFLLPVLGFLLTLPVSGLAATVGAEYCQTDACGNATISNTKPDASGFIGMMQVFGHTKRFLYGNSDFWPDDEVDCSVPGGKDCLYGDTANITFFSTHGGSDATRFRMTTGATHTVGGISTCRSYTSDGGVQWWKLGNGFGHTRILNLSTCHGLDLTDLAHWDAVAQGLHMITGFDGNESDSPSVGQNYAFWGNIGFSVKQAWFSARPGGNTAVVMAYGTTAAIAVNRRETESFGSSMEQAPPHSWRAWAWIH